MRRLLFAAVFVASASMSSSTQQSGPPLALYERPGGGIIHKAVSDGAGGIWAVGSDSGSLVPPADALQPQMRGGADAFVTHLGADGSLLYATFLGGSSSESGYGIARDGAGNLYVVGRTDSVDFPTTPGALQSVAPASWNGFIVKLDPAGRRLLYASYLGGSGADEANDVAVDAGGVAHVVGLTAGLGFPHTYRSCLDTGTSGFYSRLSADGSALLFGACLDDAQAERVTVDASGDAYVVGVAGPSFSPRMNPVKADFPSGAGSQGFLAKFSGAGIPFSTYLGGETQDWASDVAVTSRGIYVSGGGTSVQYPGAPARHPVGGSDGTAWIMKVRPDGAAILGTTLLDGSGVNDRATAVTVDASEVVHILGITNSYDFPATPDAAQPAFGGDDDTFYATAWMPTNSVSDPSYLTYLGGTGGDRAGALALDGNGGAWVAGYSDSSGFPSVNAKTNGYGTAFAARFGQPRGTAPPGAGDIVLYARDASIVGGWELVADSTAAGGTRIHSADLGVPKITTPSANPATYFELTFQANAGVAYHLWLRMKADNDSWSNDSVWVQFSDSVDAAANPVWRTGTTSGTWVGLEDCSGCGVQGWGWNDNGYGVAGTPVRFATSGTHTIRIQQREDGMSIDQVVLSSGQWASGAPGTNKNDSTIVAATQPPPPPDQPKEIVLYPAQQASINPAWAVVNDSSAAGGARLLNADSGQPKLSSPTAAGSDYFEVTFNASAGVPYHLWIRSRATNDYWTNDSVFVQFSGSVDANGAASFRIGTGNATVVSLEDCSGCGEQGWGWNDNGYGYLADPIYFATSGPQTIRVLRREDGISIDQIVLSAAKYLTSAPGAAKNDTTIVPK